MSAQSRGVSMLVRTFAAAVLGVAGCAAPVDEVEVDLPGERLEVRQIPVDTSIPTGIDFMVDARPFIRVLATGDALDPRSAFGGRTEYWAGSRAISLRDVTALRMVTSGLRSEDAALRAFLYPSASFDAALTAPQVVGEGDWSEGIYAPGSFQARLFKATDPDAPERSIGLLLEQDARGRLVAATWYKSFNTSRIFDRTPESLELTAVTDARGRPSTDPRDIDRGLRWFHFTAQR